MLCPRASVENVGRGEQGSVGHIQDDEKGKKC